MSAVFFQEVIVSVTFFRVGDSYSGVAMAIIWKKCEDLTKLLIYQARFVLM